MSKKGTYYSQDRLAAIIKQAEARGRAALAEELRATLDAAKKLLDMLAPTE